MSRLKAEHCFCQILHDSCGVPVTYKGATMSIINTEKVRDALKLYCCIIRDLCVEVDEWQKEGRIIAWAKSLSNVDLFELMSLFSLADEILLESVTQHDLRDLRVFKRTLAERTEFPVEPISNILGLLKPHLLSWFRDSSETSFAKVHEAFVFLSRINLVDNVFCADKAAELWWQCEDQLREVTNFAGDEKKIITEWFPLENLAILCEGFDPHHGSGTTAEGSRYNGDKAGLMGFDAKLFTFLQIVGWDPTFTGLMQNPWYKVPGQDLCGEIPYNWHKVLLVPKNWKTNRIVSEEPTSYMWAQLGAARAIQRYLKMRITGISRHYCVDSETLNREMALEGSIDGRWATLDLSSASDLVSWLLVTEWFRDSCLEPVIRFLRTDFAHLGDEKSPLNTIRGVNVELVQCRKFAPMGSGICFLIESIVFCAILEAIVRRTPGVSPRYWVYGDDIVCDALLAELVMQRLVELGMKPNMAKSFFNFNDGSTDFFRESCGGEYLNGIDVTPKRISRKFSGLPEASFPLALFWYGYGLHLRCVVILPSQFMTLKRFPEYWARSIAQLISLTNDLFERSTARTLIIRQMLELKIPILFDHDGSRGVKSLNPDNHHLRKRYNIDLQRWEVKAAVLRVFRKNQSIDYLGNDWLDCWDGEVRLFEYLRLAYRSNRRHLLYPEDTVGERMDPYSAELRVVLDYIEPPEDLEESLVVHG